MCHLIADYSWIHQITGTESEKCNGLYRIHADKSDDITLFREAKPVASVPNIKPGHRYCGQLTTTQVFIPMSIINILVRHYETASFMSV